MTSAAREALRLRQGAGARYDASGAPAETLAWARLGTAYLARVLNDLPDAALYEASALPAGPGRTWWRTSATTRGRWCASSSGRVPARRRP